MLLQWMASYILLTEIIMPVDFPFFVNDQRITLYELWDKKTPKLFEEFKKKSEEID